MSCHSDKGTESKKIRQLDICLSPHALGRLLERGSGPVNLAKGEFVRVVSMRRSNGRRACCILRVNQGVLVGKLIPTEGSRWRLIVRTFLASAQFTHSQRTRPLIPETSTLFQIGKVWCERTDRRAAGSETNPPDQEGENDE